MKVPYEGTARRCVRRPGLFPTWRGAPLESVDYNATIMVCAVRPNSMHRPDAGSSLAAEHLVDANRVEMRRLPFRHINRRKEETEPLSACIDRD